MLCDSHYFIKLFFYQLLYIYFFTIFFLLFSEKYTFSINSILCIHIYIYIQIYVHIYSVEHGMALQWNYKPRNGNQIKR